MKTKVAAVAAVVLFPLGAIAQIWAPRIGLTAMLLGVMFALAFVVLRQQTLLRHLVKHERLILQAQKTAANGKHESATYGASILRRVKLLTNESEGTIVNLEHASTGRMPSAPPADPIATPGSGRAATPDVSNPFTNETPNSMLTPGRALKVAGIFSPKMLPQGEPISWMPGGVVSSLEEERPELIVIDEQELRDSALWSSATTGSGTALMKDLLEGIRWAKPLGIPTYLLPSTIAPDVHSATLRNSAAVRLPLDADILEAAAGAPQTPVLQRLQELATGRVGEVS